MIISKPQLKTEKGQDQQIAFTMVLELGVEEGNPAQLRHTQTYPHLSFLRCNCTSATKQFCNEFLR